jgi:hypothetical protein
MCIFMSMQSMLLDIMTIDLVGTLTLDTFYLISSRDIVLKIPLQFLLNKTWHKYQQQLMSYEIIYKTFQLIDLQIN